MTMCYERTQALLRDRQLLAELSAKVIREKFGALAPRAAGIIRNFPEVCAVGLSDLATSFQRSVRTVSRRARAADVLVAV